RHQRLTLFPYTTLFRSMKTIEMGQEQFAHGATFYEALLAPVPRILWPGKPVAAGSGDTMSRYTRLKFDRSTSVGIGQVAEFYIRSEEHTSELQSRFDLV